MHAEHCTQNRGERFLFFTDSTWPYLHPPLLHGMSRLGQPRHRILLPVDGHCLLFLGRIEIEGGQAAPPPITSKDLDFRGINANGRIHVQFRADCRIM